MTRRRRTRTRGRGKDGRGGGDGGGASAASPPHAQDGETVRVEKKLLDANNPGLILRLNGGQRLQISFRNLEESKACLPSSSSSSSTRRRRLLLLLSPPPPSERLRSGSSTWRNRTRGARSRWTP
eukprot:3893619-Pyramimonas_sp.AAC.1